MKKIGLIFLSIMIFTGMYADVYKSTDASGNPSFSDKPSPGAQKIEVEPVQSFSMPATKAASTQDTLTQPVVNDNYKDLTIVSPPLDQYPEGSAPAGPAGATVWSNEGNVTVTVAVSPALHLGDTLQLLLNGKVVQQSKSSMTFQLSELDPNQYTVRAQIIDQDGEVKISSEPRIIFMRRHTLQQRSVVNPL